MTCQRAPKFSLQTVPFKAQADNCNDTETMAIVLRLEKLSYTSLTIPTSSVGEASPGKGHHLTFLGYTPNPISIHQARVLNMLWWVLMS